MINKTILVAVLSFILLSYGHLALAKVQTKGIYINQSTLENLPYLKSLIADSKKVGINTFVVDLLKDTKNYHKGIDLIKQNDIHYVARIVVFEDGGSASQVKSKSHWENKYKLVKTAINYGAKAIQLDYIRYSTRNRPSSQNSQDVKQVIKWFKQKVAAENIPLQVDIFGEVSFKESPRIGQNIKLFADTIDVACPMVYPSHYTPFPKHFKQPYDTVYGSLKALKAQFDGNKTPFKLTPYIEASNYHYKMSKSQAVAYITEQIKAVEDANADGWFVWSPGNKYNNLFEALRRKMN